jgi:hypothetical protein
MSITTFYLVKNKTYKKWILNENKDNNKDDEKEKKTTNKTRSKRNIKEDQKIKDK